MYCTDCRKAWRTRSDYCEHKHPLQCIGETISFSGIEVLPDFVSEDEELHLCDQMDCIEWHLSQSGRRKQVTFADVFARV